MAQRFPLPAKYLLTNWARYLLEGDDGRPKSPVGVLAALVASVPRDEDEEGYAPAPIRPPINQEAAKAVDAHIRSMSRLNNRVAKWRWIYPKAKWTEVRLDTKLRRDEYELQARLIEFSVAQQLSTIQ